MTKKSFIIAVVISIILLLLEFKLIPYLKPKLNFKKKTEITPIQSIETSKIKLEQQLKSASITIVADPKVKPPANFIEVTIDIQNRIIKVLFTPQKDMLNQVASLQVILKKSKMIENSQGGKQPKLIDLTGNKPYVTF